MNKHCGRVQAAPRFQGHFTNHFAFVLAVVVQAAPQVQGQSRRPPPKDLKTFETRFPKLTTRTTVRDPRFPRSLATPRRDSVPPQNVLELPHEMLPLAWNFRT